MPALQREAAWAEERLSGDPRQSVPQNGRVHLLGIDKSKASRKKTAFGGLTGGFVGRFCGGFLGMAGGFQGARAPADFLFSAGGFFRRIFLCLVTTKDTAKIHRKIRHFHGGLLEVGWSPGRPWANSKFSTGTLHEIGIRFVCPFFKSRLRNSWSIATAALEIPRQASSKPHRLIGQEISHSKARRQAETYTSKKRMAPPNALHV